MGGAAKQKQKHHLRATTNCCRAPTSLNDAVCEYSPPIVRHCFIASLGQQRLVSLKRGAFSESSGVGFKHTLKKVERMEPAQHDVCVCVCVLPQPQRQTHAHAHKCSSKPGSSRALSTRHKVAVKYFQNNSLGKSICLGKVASGVRRIQLICGLRHDSGVCINFRPQRFPHENAIPGASRAERGRLRYCASVPSQCTHASLCNAKTADTPVARDRHT